MPEADEPSAGALLALWNDIDPALDAAYNAWHALEHVPERLTVPGILWALRYARIGDGTMPRYLTLYGLRDAQVLDSAPYHRLLQHPTPASRAMRPSLCRLARWVCRLDVDGGIARIPQLALRAVGHDAPAPAQPTSDEGALLVATRIPDAVPLPWLSGRQAAPIAGDRVHGMAGSDLPADPAATRYARLQAPLGTPVAGSAPGRNARPHTGASMADDKSKVGQQDRLRINTSEDYEVRDWAQKFGVSADQLRAAVKAVGPIAADVQKFLKDGSK